MKPSVYDYDTLTQFLAVHWVLTLVLILHFLSDFYLQSQKLADLKKKKWSALGIHLSWVAFPLVLSGFLLPARFQPYFFDAWLAHCLIDSAKYILEKRDWIKPAWSKYVFAIDQILHLVAIFYIYYEKYSAFMSIGANPQSTLPSEPSVLNFILFLLLVGKPVNIVFKLFFSKYQPEEEVGQTTKTGAGALIGQLERLIMAIFLIWGHYAAIGLVFTAKSIARFDRISKDQSFAEYYLIGSLFSIISVLAIYLLLIV